MNYSRNIIFLTLLLLLFSGTCYAETKEIITEGTYIMGDNDTPAIAEKKALEAAKHDAFEQAKTYIESYSKTVNLKLTKDQIKTSAEEAMQTTVLDKKRIYNEGILTFWVKAKCIIDTNNLNQQFKNNWKFIDSVSTKNKMSA